MGKVVEKKKKKGRPSLLDLQKRTLKEQQQQQQQDQLKRNNNNSIPNSHANYRCSPTPLRRSTRRNPNPDVVSPENIRDGDDDDDESSGGKRREKKLKLVLKLPSQISSLNSASSNSCASDSNVEDDNVASNNKKRKINAIADGSGPPYGHKGEKPISGLNPTKILQENHLDSGTSTPLPDKKLLLFILDRLQKKDTYGVFSEPVNPDELPDYHEVIEHPMDFGTVRKKLDGGAYANLEQFELAESEFAKHCWKGVLTPCAMFCSELYDVVIKCGQYKDVVYKKDVFLICSNAMQYNAPDTIYFRQARSIQELAKKNFENLRQDSDDNEPETRIVRRGRPPTKNLRKPPVRSSLENAGCELSSDATLATGGENATWSSVGDLSGRSNVSRINDFYSNWSAENKSEKMDDFAGPTLKANTIKHGKKQFVLDENRRNTYKQFHTSAGGREPSVLTTFEGERKLLLPVGLHSEHGYARSLARFAANLGPVAWNIASKKMERCLLPGIKFGPGWVGENDVPPPMQMPQSSPAVLGTVELKNEKSSEKSEGNILLEKHGPSIHSPPGGHPTNPLPPCFIPSSSCSVVERYSESVAGKAEADGVLNSHLGSNLPSNSVTTTQLRTPFQMLTSSGLQPGMNGLNLAAHLGKLIGASQTEGLSCQSLQMTEKISRLNNNFAHPASVNSLKSDDTMLPENSNISSSSTLTNSVPGFNSPPSWKPYKKSSLGLPPQQKPELVPPDLNVRFQASGSPNSSRLDSTPDLALQL